MAQFFKSKRRRGGGGPNKNEKKVMREKQAENQARFARPLSEMYPSVQRLSIQLEFLTPQQHLFDRQVRVFEPSNACDFSVPCLGRCGGQGSFDLESKVSQVISARQTVSTGSGTCQERLYLGPEICGFRLQCKIEAVYRPGA